MASTLRSIMASISPGSFTSRRRQPARKGVVIHHNHLNSCILIEEEMVGVTGIEPVTPTMSARGHRFNPDDITVLYRDVQRTNHLHYVCNRMIFGCMEMKIVKACL